MSKSFYIGIDFGTSYSVISYLENKENAEPYVVPNSLGDTLIPSSIIVTKDFKLHFGSETNTIKEGDIKIDGIKRLLGKSYDEVIGEFDVDSLPYEIIEDKETKKAKIKVKNKIFFPYELVSLFLKKIIPETENYIDKKITNAVFTIPAVFNERQKNDLIKAAELAGIQVTKTLLEPTAAAISYGHCSKIHSGKKKNLLIFDLGGGTLDITILNFEVVNNKKKNTILNTMGNSLLGGIDFDEEILKLVKLELEKIDVKFNLLDSQTKIRIRKACEKAKKELSDKLEVKIKIKNISEKIKNFELKLTREKFEEICEGLFKKCKQLIAMAMRDSTIGLNEIDEIILIGGSTKIPKIREVIANYIKKPVFTPNEVNFSYYAVAKGAAIELSREVFNFDVINYNLGVLYENEYNTIFYKNDSFPLSDINEYDFKCNSTNNKFVLKFYKGDDENKYSNNDYIGEFSLNFLGSNCNTDSLKTIIVTFKINPNGIFSVEGFDKENRSISNYAEFSSNTNTNTKTEEQSIQIIPSNDELPAPPINNNDIPYSIPESNMAETIYLDKTFFSSKTFKSEKVVESKFRNNKVSYNNHEEESKKIVYNLETIKALEQMLNFNKLSNSNKDVYIMLVKELFINYNNYEQINKNKNLEEIKKSIYKYLNEIIEFQEFSIMEFIDLFDSDSELYNFCLLFLIKDLYKKGQNQAKSGDKIQANIYYKAALNEGKKIKNLKNEYQKDLNKIIQDCNNLCK
jgi:molecular chaperone DnaK